MKFDCGLTRATKNSKERQWHKYFLWYPKQFGDNDCRWLEYVERRRCLQRYMRFHYWSYRTMDGVYDPYSDGLNNED